MDSGCAYMFNQRNVEQLSTMYKVFSRVEQTLKYIIEQMNPYIMQEGRKIIKLDTNLKDPDSFTK